MPQLKQLASQPTLHLIPWLLSALARLFHLNPTLRQLLRLIAPRELSDGVRGWGQLLAIQHRDQHCHPDQHVWCVMLGRHPFAD
jgi:hypothetical protein